MAFPAAIHIRELGPREGFQTLRQPVPLEKKLALIEALVATGVPEIEVTAFVRPDRVPQMADAEDLVRRLPSAEGVRFTALYLNRRGFERAEASGRLQNRAWISTAASDTFLSRNSNTTVDQQLQELPAWLELFSRYERPLHGLLVSMAFGCPFEGTVESARLCRVIGRFCEAFDKHEVRLHEVVLADTVGFADPESVRQAVRDVRREFPAVAVTLHLHDTRGLGIACAYAGLLEGVACFEASVGGLGGCPFAPGAAGNIATEDLACLCSELGIATGVDLERYQAAARVAEGIVGRELPGKFYRSGACSNAVRGGPNARGGTRS